MSELQFAKQFLTTLDNKSTKYQSDHVFDPKTFQTRIPYTLPKLPHPPHPLPPRSTPAPPPPPGAEAARPKINIVLKSSRNPTISLTIPAIDPTSTSIQSLKEQVQSHLGGSSIVGIDKIKILSNKKPIPTSKKTVSDALDNNIPSSSDDVEFGIMVIGGAPDPSPSSMSAQAIATSAPESEKANLEAATVAGNDQATPMTGIEKTTTPQQPIQPGEASGKLILETSEFWDDLQGFLEQRLRDQTEAVKVRNIFEEVWKNQKKSNS